MRILLASDLHYELRQYDWLIRSASRFDAVVVAGDHLDGALPVPVDVQIAALSASFTALSARAPLLVCSGNHDLNARSQEGEKTADWLAPLSAPALAVDGDTVVIGDTLFTVCPWWDGPHAQAQLERQLDTAAARRAHVASGRWVWLYHAPPHGPLSWTGRRHFGDEVLPRLIARHAPTAVLCGHIHEAPFKADGGWADRVGGTWLFNPGRQIGDVPAHIEIDLALGTATWWSLAGVQERTLTGPVDAAQ
jgi:Icc-related predicted phosphoesterase